MKIMACYDGSNVAEEAVRLAGKHAKAFGAAVVVVTSMAGGPEVTREEFLARERELDYAKSILEDAGIDCESRFIVRGLDAGPDLVRFAGENDIKEVVLGVRRRSKVGKLLFGSTAQYVILNAPCPVVSVR